MTLSMYDRQDRVMVFIDLRNMTKSVKMDSQFSRLDFEFLVNYLLFGRKLLAAYIFDSKGVLETDDRSRAFHDLLRYKGFRVIARDSFDVEKDEQKEVDVAMACQIVVHALRDNYDTAIVVSGDRDFIPAIQEVQAAGKKVEVAAFSKHMAKEMRRAADKYYELDDVPLLSLSNYYAEESASDAKEENL